MEKNRVKLKIISLVGYYAKIKYGGYIVDGLIIDEARNMILLKTSDGLIKRFPKKAVSIYIKYDDKYLYLKNGKKIIGTPSERIKRIRHKWTKTLDKR